MLVSLFASTLFLTSALIFALEPLVAKSLLPVLGGGAAVWTTAVAFFQLALFVGYLYAHLAPTWLGLRRHAWVHVALLAAVAIALPLRSPMGWVPPPGHQALWLFGRLAISIGPVFVLLAATAPLVQRWFTSTRHQSARDPYFLYAASNAGSLAALLAYPILLEPLMGLAQQRRWWTGGLSVAVALLAACTVMARRHSAAGGTTPAESAGAGSSTNPSTSRSATPSWSERARWLVLAAVPSSLLLSVTTYMTTDLVALPLLWVLPLALYLLTFILAFAPRSLLPPGRMVWSQALLLVPLTVQLSLRTASVGWNVLPAHALVFFVTALVCHQTLAQSRPGAERATEFYLWVAAGGALGGLFSVLAAPKLFTSLVEYPLGVVLAALLRPKVDGQPGAREPRNRLLDFLLPVILAGVLVVGVHAAHAVELTFGNTRGLVALGLVLAVAGMAGYSFRFRPTRFGLGLAAILVGGGTYSSGKTQVVYATRSFYGTLRVHREPPAMTMLEHGQTLHGAQDLTPGRRREPLTYYSRKGPAGDVMVAWEGRPQRQRVGVVGLGAGTMAAYAEPGERWTFFEINPSVQEIARDPQLFTFLQDAPAPVDIVLGDARLSLAAATDGSFGILMLDAFSSDAVPAHLLTREAMALYARKLSPGGVLVVHLSNRFLDLGPVVAGSAAAAGLSGLVRFDGVTGARALLRETSSAWMVLARSASDLAPLARYADWAAPRHSGPGWTDDASNLWGALNLSGG